MTQMYIFGLAEAFVCQSRKFFQQMNHPGANNCACPKMDDGVSCVPMDMRDAWSAYLGISPKEPKA